MARRKCYLGTAEGIMAYESEDRPDGKIRFERVLHVMPDKFFGQLAVDFKSELIFAGCAPGMQKIQPGRSSQARGRCEEGTVLYRSADAGQSWEPADNGITIAGVLSLALDEATGDLYAAGDGPATLFHSRDKGKSWEEIVSLKNDPTAKTWVYHPGPRRRGWAYNPSISAVAGMLYVNIEEGWTYRSDDTGKTWHHLRNGIYIDAHIIQSNPNNPRRVWCACARGCVSSWDGGDTWEYIDHGDTVAREYCTGLAINPRDTNMVVYSTAYGPGSAGLYGGGSRVHCTTDDGKTWTDLSGGLPFPMPGQVCMMEFDQDNGLYVGTDSGDLYFSPDAGESWSNVDQRLPIRHSHKNSLKAISAKSADDERKKFFLV